jgi:hypothetical protein
MLHVLPHAPPRVQVTPAEQVPQLPPQLSGPQALIPHAGSQAAVQ